MARNAQHPPAAVAEIQGLYGPFSFPEKLLQQIWLRGDFNRSAATTTDGRHMAVLDPGRWNLLGGPDFQSARLRIGEEPEMVGDVELHLHAADWSAHAHARDRAYDGVGLHVVLFPPPRGYVTVGAGGREIPVLVLLPLLHHDLEEYAAEAAVEALAGRTMQRLPEELASLDAAEVTAQLQAQAAERWRQKVHFARLRGQRLSWEAACHHAALEILGYRFNRAPMLRLAGRWPLGEWARGAVNPDEAFANEAGAWRLQGVRPANHPRARLRQYAAWVQARPDWPARLAAVAVALPDLLSPSSTTSEVRRALGFSKHRKKICGAHRRCCPWHPTRQSGQRRFPAAAGCALGPRCRGTPRVVPLVPRRSAAASGARVAATRRVWDARLAPGPRAGTGFVGLVAGARSTLLSRRTGRRA